MSAAFRSTRFIGLFVGALASSLTGGCNIVAGLEDHELIHPFGIPDSASAVCSNGETQIDCSEVPGEERQDGTVLSPPPNFTRIGPDVRDEVTGLTWRASPGRDLNHAEAAKYCQNIGYRLPSRLELDTLMDFHQTSDAKALIDPENFPDVDGKLHWTETPYAGLPESFWIINFCVSCVDQGQPNSGRNIGLWDGTLGDALCVKNDGTRLVPHFQPTDNPDVTRDLATGLEWFTRPDNNSSGSWIEALQHCESSNLGGFEDWRLPNIKELDSLVNLEEASADVPALLPPFSYPIGYAPTAAISLWSSTPTADGTLFHYLLAQGASTNMANVDYFFPLCVRGPINPLKK